MEINGKLLVLAYPVKYHSIEYRHEFVVVRQNKTKKRIYKGWYFEDNGCELYISTAKCAGFQHSPKIKKFLLDTATKGWEIAENIEVKVHVPEAIEAKTISAKEELTRCY